MSRFDDFLPVLFEFEIEYNPDGSLRIERDPNDPFGATRFGLDQHELPGINIATLTAAQAREIHLGLWGYLRCEALPRPLGELLMDITTNGGPGAPWIQRAVGTKADGWIGPKTLAAAHDAAAHGHRLGLVVDWICDRREERFRRIATGQAKKFLRGWLNRNATLRRWALEHLTQEGA